MATAVEKTPAREPAALAASTLCEAFQITSAERPDAVAHRTPGDGVVITWAEYAERVPRIAAGLASLGVERGDTLALMLINRPEFNLIDCAALHLGATPFSIYNTSAPDQIVHVVCNAGSRVIVTERQFLARVHAVLDRTPLEHVICLDGGAMTLDELEEQAPDDFHF